VELGGESSHCPVNIKENKMDNPVTCFNYAGGRTKTACKFLKYIPNSINNLYDLFAGPFGIGYKIHDRVKGKIVISDIDYDVINAHIAIRDNPEILIAYLEIHKENDSEAYFKSLKLGKNPIYRASVFIYKCKRSWFGLNWNFYNRVSTNPIFDKENIHLCSQVLRNATIIQRDFEKAERYIKSGDLVMLDAPFCDSARNFHFTRKDTVRLRDFAMRLHKKGAKLFIVLETTEFNRGLFSPTIFNIATIKITNLTRNDKDSRYELVITNYKTKETPRMDTQTAENRLGTLRSILRENNLTQFEEGYYYRVVEVLESEANGTEPPEPFDVRLRRFNSSNKNGRKKTARRNGRRKTAGGCVASPPPKDLRSFVVEGLKEMGISKFVEKYGVSTTCVYKIKKGKNIAGYAVNKYRKKFGLEILE
jgi:site-specific DNA-adenine methylase